MLTIDNREEIQQYLLKETESPEETEEILALLENQVVLSMIYDKYKENDVLDNYQPHSLGEINNESCELYDFDFYGNDFACIDDLSTIDLIELVAAILTLGDYTNKAYKKVKGKINNYMQTNAAKIIESRIKDLLTDVIKMIKIKETREDDEKTTDG